jgi:predicted DsbA family dithiol-disulfide isomerase
MFIRVYLYIITNCYILKRKIEKMESKYDEQFQIVFEAIKQLLKTDEKPKRKIGF